MNIEEAINHYLELKNVKEVIKNIDPEFFFNFAETVITAYEKEKSLEENHKIAFKKQTENLHEVEEMYEKEKEKNKDLEKMLNLKSHKRRYNTMNYIKKNKLNKYDTVGICQDMRAFKRTGEIKYRAYITFQNKQYTLGTYTSLDKAKEARRKGEAMVENIKKNFVEKIKGEE